MIEEKKRLLCIVNEMNTGGAETFLMKIYRALDRTKFQMDFICMTDETGHYEEEILRLGGKIYHIIPKTQNFLKSFFSIKNIVRHNGYQNILRLSEHSLATLDLLAAKYGGAKKLIQRSCNADSSTAQTRILHKAFRFLPTRISNLKIAPSINSAVYAFGKKSVARAEVMIINNAIPVEKFRFDMQRRIEKRKLLGINDEYVIGHIGRFSGQKNHNFILDVFYEAVKKAPHCLLVLIGEGDLLEKMKRKAQELDISEKVKFLGVCDDIPDLLMAMDSFIFPSLFEGMPNVIIEAQATGLPCYISDSITQEVKLTDFVYFKSLNDHSAEWAMDILDSKNKFNPDIRGRQCDYIKQKGFDINLEVEKIKSIFFDV